MSFWTQATPAMTRCNFPFESFCQTVSKRNELGCSQTGARRVYFLSIEVTLTRFMCWRSSVTHMQKEFSGLPERPGRSQNPKRVSKKGSSCVRSVTFATRPAAQQRQCGGPSNDHEFFFRRSGDRSLPEVSPWRQRAGHVIS